MASASSSEESPRADFAKREKRLDDFCERAKAPDVHDFRAEERPFSRSTITGRFNFEHQRALGYKTEPSVAVADDLVIRGCTEAGRRLGGACSGQGKASGLARETTPTRAKTARIGDPVGAGAT